MTGSVALDVVIGLVFIFLLYSLLATVICEMIATKLGLRARNLRYAIQRMLDDESNHGLGSKMFYQVPLIKYLGQNKYHSKPSYIAARNFSNAVIEIFRKYGGNGDKSDLEKIQNVLKGALEYQGVLQEIKETLNDQFIKDPGHSENKTDFKQIRDNIKKHLDEDNGEDEKKFHYDPAQITLLENIKGLIDSNNDHKSVVSEIDQMLNLFGRETNSHLQSLLKDANNDLAKFRLLLEQWFEDTMERATSWYKQRIQLILMIVGFVLAVVFNANTIEIAKKLSVDKDARDKLVTMAEAYAKVPANRQVPLSKADSNAFKNDAIINERLDSLDKIRVILQKDVDEANSLLGLGWNLPDSLQVLPFTKLDSLRKVKKSQGTYSKVFLNNDQKDSVIVMLGGLGADGLNYLEYSEDKATQRKYFEGYNSTFTSINFRNGFLGYICYVAHKCFSWLFFGFLLTAIAISLGSPFWFDMLNKLMQLRGSVKASDKGTQTALATQPASDPAHPINRKG